jgi:iron complex transport system substrate-binding protein
LRVFHAPSTPRLPFLSIVALVASVAVAEAAPLVIHDDLGQTLHVDRTPRRIVSLSPALTEMLFAMGLDDAIVGVSDFCNYPPAALDKPKVGGIQPNFEAVVALKPDLVVSTGGAAMRSVARQLARFHIPMLGVEPDSVEAILARITLLGQVTDRPDAAAALVNDMRRRLATIAANRSDARAPRVLYLVDDTPPITIGPKSFLYDVVRKAGGRPLETGANESYPRVGMEAIVRFDPEVIFFAGDSDAGAAAHGAAWQRWRGITAVNTNRMYAIPRDLVNRPGPRIIDAIEFIASTLQPADQNRRAP